MNYGKRIALSRSAALTDSDSAIGEDFDDDARSHKRAGGGKDKVNRNLSEKKRRDQFNMLVNELCTMVSTTNKKMDKSTVLKSTISFLKDHQETANQAHVHEIKEEWKPSFLTNDEFMHLMLEACDSFLLVFSQQGVVLYASESVTSLLGHLPSDMVNRSIYDYVGKAESANLHNILYNYRVVSGQDIPEYEKDGEDDVLLQAQSTNKDQVYFLCTVRLQTTQLVREMSNVDDNKEFTSRHSLEWKFLFLDHRAPPIIGYLPFEVLGTSGYDYYHPDDLEGVTTSHEQCNDEDWRGDILLLQILDQRSAMDLVTDTFFITYHQWNSKPEFINCTNTVVSYADVRSQKRKDLGIVEEELSSADVEPMHSMFGMSRSSSVGSVTSAGISDSNLCAASEKEGSENSLPTSTSQVRSRTVSQQLQQFLQRHLQQQQQQQQQQQSQTSMTARTIQSQTTHSTTTTTSYSNLPLQHVLYGRQQLQQKSDSQPTRILPRPSTSSMPDQQTSLQVAVNTPSTDTSSIAMVASSPSVISISPINVVGSPPTNLYMTPVQRQLHEQLQRKAGQVQDAILRQQEELRKIHQQLMFAQGNLPVLNTNPEVIGAIGGEHSRVIQSPPSLPASQHPQQQQQHLLQPHLQQNEQSPGVPMVAVHNMMVNHSPVLPFPMLPQDAEIYLSLTDTSEPPSQNIVSNNGTRFLSQHHFLYSTVN